MDRACRACGEKKPLADYYKHPFGADGRDTRCKECAKKAVRENRAAKVEYYREYEKTRLRDPGRVLARQNFPVQEIKDATPEDEKRAARITLGNAVRDGKITKPPTCQVCGTPADVHGHHDDYSKHLEVIWCCSACHALIHAYWRARIRAAF